MRCSSSRAASPTERRRWSVLPPNSTSRTCISRSEEHTSELQSHLNLVCRLLLEKKNNATDRWSFAEPASPLSPHTLPCSFSLCHWCCPTRHAHCLCSLCSFPTKVSSTLLNRVAR